MGILGADLLRGTKALRELGRRFFERLPTRWLFIQSQLFPLSQAAKAGDADRLLSALAETAKQVSSFFSIYAATAAYGIVTVLQTSGRSVYVKTPELKLPLLDVVVSPQLLLVAIPAIVLAMGTYLQSLVGYLRHLQRVEQLTNDSLQTAIDKGFPFPALPALSRQPGLSGKFASFVGWLADRTGWALSPVLAVLCFLRSIVLRDASRWTLYYTGAVAIVATGTNLFWALGRREIAQRSALMPRTRAWPLPWLAAASFLVAVAGLTGWAVHADWPLQALDRYLTKVGQPDWVFPMEPTVNARGLHLRCVSISGKSDVSSMALGKEALYVLAGKTTLSEIGLADFKPISPPMEKTIQNFPTRGSANGVGGAYPAGGPMLVDGNRVFFSISFEPSGPRCMHSSTPRPATCEWNPRAADFNAQAPSSACGSIWSFEGGSLPTDAGKLRLISDDEAYVSGLAIDGTRVYWARTYPDCELSDVRVGQEDGGSRARNLYPIRPESQAARIAEGGGIAVAHGALFWLSGGVRTLDGSGGLLSMPRFDGILYSGARFSNSDQELVPRALMRYLDRPASLVTDGSDVFFGTTDGRIWRYSDGHLSILYTRLGQDTVAPMAHGASSEGSALIVADAFGFLSVSLGEEPHEVSRLSGELPGIRALAVSERADMPELYVYAATSSGIFFCESPLQGSHQTTRTP
jgi:hypothetical protein